ncbi:F0F1 ATP synthase subunit I [Phytohalomonas tamaricis]|uniref:F0F1 ATP synthase subunit I n=1 Tax=Phytohalomonas tamaricis TaxID=2081032 RepID=UPI000D0AFAFF|nr:F0F1 ATP synthase subunit I [Phytohalomonas tamaricis]
MHYSTPAALKRPHVYRLLIVQLAVALVLTVISALTQGYGAAQSALLGGLVCLLPNLYFAWRAFRVQGARMARQIITGFYKAEAGKFGLTVALFTIVFITAPPSNPAFFFGAYVAVQLVHWLGPWLVLKRSST